MSLDDEVVDVLRLYLIELSEREIIDDVDLEGEGSENDRVLVSVQEAALRAGVTPATIRTWIESGRLEAFRIEGDRRFYVALD